MRAFLSALIILALVGCNSNSVEVPVEENTVEVIVDSVPLVVEEVDSIETKVVDTVSVELKNSIPSHFSDIRDGKEYKIVKIGEQIWMSENLAFRPDSGNFWAYNDDNSNVDKYGYLYDGETAKEVCPVGWHLPSHEEWGELINFLGGEKDVAKKLKSTLNWKVNGNGTNESGFNAIAGGSLYTGKYQYIDSIGSWWTSSFFNESAYWSFDINYTIVGQGPYDIMNGIERMGTHSIAGLSVRCIKD